MMFYANLYFGEGWSTVGSAQELLVALCTKIITG